MRWPTPKRVMRSAGPVAFSFMGFLFSDVGQASARLPAARRAIHDFKCLARHDEDGFRLPAYAAFLAFLDDDHVRAEHSDTHVTIADLADDERVVSIIDDGLDLQPYIFAPRDRVARKTDMLRADQQGHLPSVDYGGFSRRVIADAEGRALRLVGRGAGNPCGDEIAFADEARHEACLRLVINLER